MSDAYFLTRALAAKYPLAYTDIRHYRATSEHAARTRRRHFSRDFIGRAFHISRATCGSARATLIIHDFPQAARVALRCRSPPARRCVSSAHAILTYTQKPLFSKRPRAAAAS